MEVLVGENAGNLTEKCFDEFVSFRLGRIQRSVATIRLSILAVASRQHLRMGVTP